MTYKLTTTAISLLILITGPGCASADNRSTFLDKPILLDEVIHKSIEVPNSEPLESLDRVYLVAYNQDEEPICSRYQQRIASVEWIRDLPVQKYEIDYQHPYQCPERE